jgi:AraC-like DNA-binding protein
MVAELNVKRWSTDGAPRGEELDYWAGAVCQAFFHLNCSSAAKSRFYGEIRCLPVDDLTVSYMRSEQQTISQPRDFAGQKDAFYLVVDFKNGLKVKQRGRESQASPGDAVLIDAREPYAAIFPYALELIAIELPNEWTQRWLGTTDLGGRILARNQPWAHVLSATCIEFVHDLSMATRWPGIHLSDHLGGLLAAALRAQDDRAESAAKALAQRALKLMLQRLAEPGLSPADIARDAQVPVPTLHRALASEGANFSVALTDLRMKRARQLLHSERLLPRLTVESVATRCGYADTEQFARAYKDYWQSAMDLPGTPFRPSTELRQGDAPASGGPASATAVQRVPEPRRRP